MLLLQRNQLIFVVNKKGGVHDRLIWREKLIIYSDHIKGRTVPRELFYLVITPTDTAKQVIEEYELGSK